VRITEGEGEEKGLVLGGGAEKLVGGFGKADHVLGGDGVAAGLALGFGGGEVEGILLRRADVLLADECGTVALGFKFFEDRRHIGAQALVVLVRGVSVLAVAMGEHARVDDRPAGAARGDRGKGLAKTHALGGEAVHVRGLDEVVAVAAEVEPILVVGDDKEDVPRRGGRRAGAGGEEGKEKEKGLHGSWMACPEWRTAATGCSLGHKRRKILRRYIQ